MSDELPELITPNQDKRRIAELENRINMMVLRDELLKICQEETAKGQKMIAEIAEIMQDEIQQLAMDKKVERERTKSRIVRNEERFRRIEKCLEELKATLSKIAQIEANVTALWTAFDEFRTSVKDSMAALKIEVATHHEAFIQLAKVVHGIALSNADLDRRLAERAIKDGNGWLSNIISNILRGNDR